MWTCCFWSLVSRSLILRLRYWLMGSEYSTPTHSFENSLHLLCFLLSCLFFSPSREDGALSFPEISFENCNSLSTNVNFIKASFNTSWEFGFFFSNGTISTFKCNECTSSQMQDSSNDQIKTLYCTDFVT